MFLRRLGSFDGAEVVIANVIGTGIFLTPFIAQRVQLRYSTHRNWRPSSSKRASP